MINARITSFHFMEEEISLMMKNLDPAKALGCDKMSTKMIKNESLTLPLRIYLSSL